MPVHSTLASGVLPIALGKRPRRFLSFRTEPRPIASRSDGAKKPIPTTPRAKLSLIRTFARRRARSPRSCRAFSGRSSRFRRPIRRSRSAASAPMILRAGARSSKSPRAKSSFIASISSRANPTWPFSRPNAARALCQGDRARSRSNAGLSRPRRAARAHARRTFGVDRGRGLEALRNPPKRGRRR